MSDREPKKKLVGPWRSLQVVIWLGGIYVLASHGWWWPGILVLLAISAAYEGLLQRFAPEAFEEQPPAETPKPEAFTRLESAPVMAPNPLQEHRIELLPQVCPSCNAPIRSNEVKWTGAQSANCPYCGTNLPMSKA
jgi:hypothetical protein